MNTTFFDKENYIELYINQAREDRAKFWKPFLRVGLLLFIIGILFEVTKVILFGVDSFPIISQIIFNIINFFLVLAIWKYVLHLIDGKKISFIEAIKGLTPLQVFYAFIATFLVTILIYIGLILLVVPGIVVSLMFMFVTLIPSEKEMKPLAILKESRFLTRDYKRKIFVGSLSVAVHYFVVPLCMAFVYVLSVTLGAPAIIGVLAAIIGVSFGIYGYFALFTLTPRMYRDLQAIKYAHTNDSQKEAGDNKNNDK